MDMFFHTDNWISVGAMGCILLLYIFRLVSAASDTPALLTHTVCQALLLLRTVYIVGRPLDLQGHDGLEMSFFLSRVIFLQHVCLSFGGTVLSFKGS